jgi:hypothetical protein
VLLRDCHLLTARGSGRKKYSQNLFEVGGRELMGLGVLVVSRTGLCLREPEGFLTWLEFLLSASPDLHLAKECLKAGMNYSCTCHGLVELLI